LKVNPELFLVGVTDGKIVAAVMGGYEGHRGWINYLAVDPAYQRKGYGRQLMAEIEKTTAGFGLSQDQPAGAHRQRFGVGVLRSDRL